MRTTLRKIGKSAAAILPAATLDQLHLKVGDSVKIAVRDGRIIIQPCKVGRKYTLSELLAQCDANAPFPKDLTDWDQAPAVGREQL